MRAKALLLSLLLCATCLAQPDSRPGPYQATLAKINALLVGGAATVKEIEFTTDGSALASSSKTQVYSDGNAGNLFTNVPTGKYEQHRVAGVGLLSLGRQQGVQGDNYWAIGGWAANGALSNAISGIFAITGMGFNVPTGNAYQFNFAGVEEYRLSSTLQESPSLSLGGTIGSSTDGGIGSLALTNRIQFAGAGTADATKSLIYSDAANGNIYINVPTGKYEQHRMAGNGLLSLGRYSSTQGDSSWAVGKWAANGNIDSSASGVYGHPGIGIVANVNTGDSYQFAIGGGYRMKIDENGVNLGATGSPLATTATIGHPRMPSCAGAPTGVPANIMTGTVPFVIDTTNGRLYAYYGGSWHYATFN